MAERLRPVVSAPAVYLVLENIWDKMRENKQKFPMWPANARELEYELQSRYTSMSVLVRTVTKGVNEGTKRILFCTSTYYLQAEKSRQGDGYIVIDMQPLGFREHDGLARGAPRLEVGNWVVLHERAQLNFCAPRPTENSNRYQEILNAWDDMQGEQWREIAPEEVEEFLTPRQERYLNKIEKLIQASYEAELEKGKDQQAILYSNVDPVGKARYGRHDIYMFYLVPDSPGVKKGMFLCFEDDPAVRGHVTEVEEDGFVLRFEKPVDIKDVRSSHALIQVVIHAAFRVQRDAIESLRERQAANPYLLDILAENRYHAYAIPKMGLATPTTALNGPQQEAFVQAQAVQDMLLVLGPPGTGKTLTIQEIIRACGKNGERVLLTAKTHKAVDNVLQQLPTDQLQVLRIGQEDKVGLRELLLDEQAKKLQKRVLEGTSSYSEELQKINGHLDEYDGLVNRCPDYLTSLEKAENIWQQAIAALEEEHERISSDYAQEEQRIKTYYGQEKQKINQQYIQEKLRVNTYFEREKLRVNTSFEQEKLGTNRSFEREKLRINTYFGREEQMHTIDWQRASRSFEEWQRWQAMVQGQLEQSRRRESWPLIGFFWREQIPGLVAQLATAGPNLQRIQKERDEALHAFQKAQRGHKQASEKIQNDHQQVSEKIQNDHRLASEKIQEEHQQASQKAGVEHRLASEKIQEEHQQAAQRAQEEYQQAYLTEKYRALQQQIEEKEQILSRLTEKIHPEAMRLASILLGHFPPADLRQPERNIEDIKSYLHWFYEAWRERIRQQFCDRHQIMQEWRQELQTRQEDLYPLLLRMADVIGATCIGSATAKILADVEFNVVIVDEAGQISIPDLLVPLVRGKRALLFGDHQQLPPQCDEDIQSRLRLLPKREKEIVEEEAEEGFEEDQAETMQEPQLTDMLEKSVFELLIEQGVDKQHYVAFTQQHRMPASIAKFASQHFYNGKLETAGRHKQGSRYRDPLFKKPFVFVDTSSMGARLRDEREYQATKSDLTEIGSNKSITNEGEAGLITDLVEVYAREQIEWVVIVPYRAQAGLLREKIAERLGQELELDLNNCVATVDTFQGGERDVVIYGFTRSNPRRKIGFLKERRRLNVALTRAKEQLVLVGNGEMLKEAKDEPFKVLAQALLEHALESGEFLSFRECRSRMSYYAKNGGKA